MTTKAMMEPAVRAPGHGTGPMFPSVEMHPSSDLTLKSQRQRRKELTHEASLLNSAGRTEELRRCLETILELDPKDTYALYNLGVLAVRQGEQPKAERLLRRTINCDADYIDAYQTLGDMHFQARHLMSAVEIYERGLRQIPTRLPLLASLLRATITMRAPQRVELAARRILNIDNEDKDALNALAWADIVRRERLDEARRCLTEVLARSPRSSSALALAEYLAELNGDAATAARHRATLDAIVAEEWSAAVSAAETLISIKEAARAATVVREYLKRYPNDPAAQRYLAVALMQDGDFAGGHAILSQVLEIAGNKSSLQMVYCLNAFRMGDLQSFYRYHRTRWQRDGADELWDLPVPEWDGSPIPRGKLIIQCEQGVGDYVMFAVCFPGLAPAARDVIVKVMPRMHSLFRRSFPELRFIHEDKLPPDVPMEAVAAGATAGDLPELLGGDIENLPGKAGVLVADPNIKAKLRKRYEEMFPGKRLIGISWRSGNRDSAAMRSLDLPFWKPLFDVPGCAFISLQYGDVTHDLEELKTQLGDRVYWDREINPTGDMDPFAAQVSAMDLVISVDNSTVHFAGGLGKPCWAMLPLNSDWRWQVDRTDTVWYDSVELIRPNKEGGWDEVAERVAKRLGTLDDAMLKEAEIAYLKRALATMMKANRLSDAEQYGRMLLAAGVQKAQAMHAVARSALAAGQAEDATGILLRAVELDGEDPAIWAELAGAIAKTGDTEQGLALARQLTRRFPASNDVSVACGSILSDLARYDEATDFFARVLRRDPENVASRQALATLQAAQGDFDLARRNYDRIVAIDPSNAGAHAALAETLLRLEEWPAGWTEFQWRFGTRPGILPPHLSAIEPEKQPKIWSSGGLRKQRILVTAERNPAEQILLAGMLPDIIRESRKVTLECDGRIAPIMIASFPALEVIPRAEITEPGLADRSIQVVSTLGDLARRFRGTAEDFPEGPKPPLTADRTRVAELRQEYLAAAGGRTLVGLSWRHGKDTPAWRCPLDVWLPLIESSDVLVVTLHPTPCDDELAAFAKRSGSDLIFDRNIDTGRDFADYAAQIQACDFVIAVEDLTALLAGSLGRPTVKLKKPVDHWWWGTAPGVSRWLPSLRTVDAPNGIGAPEVLQTIGILMERMASR
jgi:tetratricopeptide (TPR) repeat protein